MKTTILQRSPAAKVASVAILTTSLMTQQVSLGVGVEDEVPIRMAVQETVEEKQVESWDEFNERIALLEAKIEKGVQVRKVATQQTAVVVKHQAPQVNSGADPEVQDRVYAYFADIPEMIYVAECESTFRQFEVTGEVLRGRAVSADVGVMQINEYYHLDRARSLGYDIHSLEGNMGYARFLYEEQGLQPWNASRPCWSAKLSLARG